MSNNDYAIVKLSKPHKRLVLERINRAKARNFALLTYLDQKAHIGEIGLWLDEVEEAIRATDVKLSDLYSIVNRCELVGSDNYCWVE